MTITDPISTHDAPLTELIERAARPIPVLWPLRTAIAINPLWDLRDTDFDSALATAAATLGIDGLPSPQLLADAYRRGRITDIDLAAALADHSPHPTDLQPCPPARAPLRTRLHTHQLADALTVLVDLEVSKWCATYIAGTTAHPNSGFYTTWRQWMRSDRVARRWGIGDAYRLPDTPHEAILNALYQLNRTDDDEQLLELTAQLGRLPGWAAHAKWRTMWAPATETTPALDLVNYLAVRLSYEATLYLVAPTSPLDGPPLPTPLEDTTTAALPTPTDPTLAATLQHLPLRTQQRIWLHAYENHYRDRLLTALNHADRTEPSTSRPQAQLVFCIDTRSEGLRRHLEALGDYPTYGFAGFFGVPARVEPWHSDDRLDLLPALLTPSVTITQQPTDRAHARRATEATDDLTAGLWALRSAQKSPLASYLLAEAGGCLLGPAAFARTVAPRAASTIAHWLRTRITPDTNLHYLVSGPTAPTDDEQTQFAETMLRATGLTDTFARVVTLCGHGSTTTNNPYASALDCGACGAARGATSARIAAAMLNRPAIRMRLRARGIDIPTDTVFVAAEHDTTTDVVAFFDTSVLPDTHRADIAQLRDDLARAGRALAAERATDLPGAPRRNTLGRNAHTHAATRAADWAQLQPEWGLARNAAFLIAPRQLSAPLNLQRRCFLHSYEPDADTTGATLEAIMTGPMVVAHWINAAYYFSTVDPTVLGAGDKSAHNIIGEIGVFQGAGSDLKLGLPHQSVYTTPHRPYHEPMRLLVAITAPRQRIDAIIDAHRDITHLVNGNWLTLAAHDNGTWWLRRGHNWEPWHTPTDPHQLENEQ
ncbi:DUF2309 domain-containing protein [Gordonia sp. AC31]|uniref:DUF2309 domain-containing protein n=1 Tax=Gordonia TaxID=2053 RepID=UPI0028818784|nr:DUF2309 domain-containing protein [Gordonia sp. AC31]MDT0224028.1 DUF2309 domain-containing protein [Gordonia sp. AC31]